MKRSRKALARPVEAASQRAGRRPPAQQVPGRCKGGTCSSAAGKGGSRGGKVMPRIFFSERKALAEMEPERVRRKRRLVSVASAPSTASVPVQGRPTHSIVERRMFFAPGSWCGRAANDHAG